MRSTYNASLESPLCLSAAARPAACASRQMRHWVSAVLGSALCLTVATSAFAEKAPKGSDAQMRYQSERAACMRGDTNQDRKTCLIEAGAAYAEARRGRIPELKPEKYTENQLQRCRLLPEADREDCQLRMQGEGVTVGSFEQGGIYRELVRTLPAQPAQAAQPAQTPQ